jgi:hypothetical protein
LPARWIEQIAAPSTASADFGSLPLGSPWLRERRLSPSVNYYSLVGEPFARGALTYVMCRG